VSSELLKQAIALIKAGRKEQARPLIVRALKANPRDETAWLWLVETLPDDAQRIAALEQYLRINPDNQRVRVVLARMRAKATLPVAPPPVEVKPAESLTPPFAEAEGTSAAASADGQLPSVATSLVEAGKVTAPAQALADRAQAPAVGRRSRLQTHRRKQQSWLFIALLALAVLLVVGWAVRFVWDKPTSSAERLSATQTLAAHLATASARETQSARTYTPVHRLFETARMNQTTRPPSATSVPSQTATASPTHTPQPSRTPTPTVTPTFTPYPTMPAGLLLANGQIAYVSDRDGNRNIFVMNADGSGQTRLTEGLNLQPDWSPDGTRLVYSGLDGASPESGDMEIFVMLADGSNKVALTANDFDDSFPAWSPDGRRIAFVSDRDGNWELYVMNADGSNQTRLTSTPADESYPTWSADGQRIAFAAALGERSDIYVIGLQGGEMQPLTETGDNFFPNWSPDGSRIVFVSTRGGNLQAPFDAEIFIMNADGSGQVQLTDTAPAEYDPAWSPDGQSLICSVSEFGDPPLFILDLNGRVLARLPKGFEGMYEPDWQPLPLAVVP